MFAAFRPYLSSLKMHEILLLFALLQFVTPIYTKQEDNNILTSHQQQIRTELFEELVSQIRTSWTEAEPDKNLQFIPLALLTCKNAMEIRAHYEGLAAIYYPKDRLLQIAFSYAKKLDAFEQSTNVKLKFKNAIFYDEKDTNRQYLNDLKTRYHAEAYVTSFDPNNTEATLTLFNDWMHKTIKGNPPKIKSPLMPGMNSFQTTLFTFTGCWNALKITRNSIEELKFKISKGKIDVKTFNSKESIGYYNNPELKFEAIRLPYKNDEFAMAIVLPYQNQSLELFRNITDMNHLEILERLNENHENVNYIIPFINSTIMTLNENGTSVNGDDPIVCDWPSVQRNPEINKGTFKQFYVDRPFGVYIYSEKTKYVFLHALVRNPTEGLGAFHRFSGKYAPREKGKYPLIPSYVVYY